MRTPLIAITEPSSGIGAATAKAPSAAGQPLLLMAKYLVKMQAPILADCMNDKADITDRVVITGVSDKSKYRAVVGLLNKAEITRHAAVGEQSPAERLKAVNTPIKGGLNAPHPFYQRHDVPKIGSLASMRAIAGPKVHTAHCGCKQFARAIPDSLRSDLAPHDGRAAVILPGVIKAALLDRLNDPGTLAADKDNGARLGEGVSADPVAGRVLIANQVPQSDIVQEIVVTPTRREL